MSWSGVGKAWVAKEGCDESIGEGEDGGGEFEDGEGMFQR